MNTTDSVNTPAAAVTDDSKINKPVVHKLVLVGDSCGKSSVLRRLADKQFTETYNATVGVDFRFKDVNFDKNTIKLQIWDTAGQPRFKTITAAYLRGVDCVVLMYDIGSLKTLEDLRELIRTAMICSPNCVFYLLGNKCDLPGVVSKETVDAFVAEHGIEWHMNVSALTGENVEEAFLKIAQESFARLPLHHVVSRRSSNLSDTVFQLKQKIQEREEIKKETGQKAEEMLDGLFQKLMADLALKKQQSDAGTLEQRAIVKQFLKIQNEMQVETNKILCGISETLKQMHDCLKQQQQQK